MRAVLCLALCWLFGAAYGAGVGAVAPSGGQPASRYPTPAETRAEFRSLCERQRYGLNPFYSDSTLEELQRRLQVPSGDPRVESEERGRLAYELVRVGRHEEAIEQLQKARSTLDAAGIRAPALENFLLSLQAMAHFQIGEDLNCVALHSEASCILPLRDEAIHSRPEHSRKAGDLYLEVLEKKPDDIAARWLLNLSRMVSGDFPAGVPEELRLPSDWLENPGQAGDFRLWIDVAPRLAIDAFDLAGGAVMDDFDGDGLLDLVSSSMDPCEPMKAYRNDGRGGFADVSREWGLDSQLGGLNLVHADYDNDGMLDLLVLRGAWFGTEGRMRNSLLRNDLARQAKRFVDVTSAVGLAYPAYPTQAAAWADYDRDGDLDLLVANEADDIVIDPMQLKNLIAHGYPSQLFRNNGDGTFSDVARVAGVIDRGFGKGVAWGDYDNDGDPDLYISNLGPNRLFRNEGDGRFTDVTAEAEVGAGDRRTFATWFFDYDNDGDLDLLVASYNVPSDAVAASYLGLDVRNYHWSVDILRLESNPILFRNEGGRFTDVSVEVGLVQPLLVMGANYGDFDSDGWQDLYFGTGMPDFTAVSPNVLYRNQRGHFVDLTFAVGLGHLQKGHGVAFGDIDNDGHQDLFQQLGGAFPYDAFGNALYRNPGSEHHWIVLRLRGTASNRFALGARLRIVASEGGRRRSIYRLVGSGGSFGGSSFQLEVGLGNADTIESIEVRWPGGLPTQEFTGVAPDRYYELVEGEPELRRLEVEPVPFDLRPPGALDSPTHSPPHPHDG